MYLYTQVAFESVSPFGWTCYFYAKPLRIAYPFVTGEPLWIYESTWFLSMLFSLKAQDLQKSFPADTQGPLSADSHTQSHRDYNPVEVEPTIEHVRPMGGAKLFTNLDIEVY